MRALRIVFALAVPSLALAGGSAVPRPHVDPDAIREARGDGPASSARAISHYLEALRCQEVANWRCAVAELDLAAAYDERSPDLRAALAEALAMTGQAARAETEAHRAVELSSGAGPAATRAHVLLAQLAAGRDREQAALELRLAVHVEADAAGAGQPPDPDPWRLLAILYLEMGDEQAADRALDDLAALAPGESDAAREAGRWLLERHRPGRAERFLRRAVLAARDDAQAWRLLAQVHQELGRSPEVKEDLEAVLQAEPDDPEALFGLASAALAEDDLGRARDLFQRYQRNAWDRSGAAVRVAAEWLEVGRPADALECVRGADAAPDPRLRLAEGLALQRLRRWPEAAEVLGRIGADDGDAYLPARAAMAEALSRAGRTAAAGRALAAPLRERPGEVRLLVTHASVLERAGRTREAESLLERAALAHEQSGEPEDGAALRIARAALLCRAGRAREAVAWLEPAVAARARSAPLRIALASALREAGAPGRAAAELRALLALEPDEPDALPLLASVLVDLAASPASGPGRLDEAETLARRGVALRPRSPEALDAFGRVRSARGDHAGALAALERAVVLGGHEARYLDDLGEAYRAAGRPREAAAAWRRALAASADEVPPVAERMRASLRQKLREGGRGVAERRGAAASPLGERRARGDPP